jgi:bleomycin hydrolase
MELNIYKNMKKTISVVLLFAFSMSFSQNYKAKFEEKKDGYYQKVILKSIEKFEKKEEKKKRKFNYDFSNLEYPSKISDYKTTWHSPTISQGNTGTCWAFSTTSFFESEIKRIYNKEIDLSELHTVYWEYVEKARRFIQKRGDSFFPQGSEANAVTRIYKMYGAMPAEAFTGLKEGQKFHNHEPMFKEMEAYLNSLKISNAWNEEQNLETIKAIMKHYIGTPPSKFKYKGQEYSAKSFLKNVAKLNMDEYYEVLSYRQQPYWQTVEYEVPDNWWHSKDYYNLPLDTYMKILKKSIKSGYTMSIGGDVSESGFGRWSQACIIPVYDIPEAYITEDARQFRFSNHTTEDDHGMHLVGYVENFGKDKKTWYLIKDSSSGSRNNSEKANEFGFYFFREDYVKLKMMGFTVHKDMIKEYLPKFK